MNASKLILALGLILSCDGEVPSYDMAMKYCHENMETTEVIDENGLDTIKYQHMPYDCIEGFKLPRFDLQAIDGQSISNDALLGKVSIINFWFENCPPCIAEIPGLNTIRNRYGTDDVNYIAISTYSSEDVKKFIEKTPFEFVHIANGEDIYRQTFQAMWGFPFTIISDRQNIILKAFGGGRTDSLAISDIINKIEPVLSLAGVYAQ